MQVEQADLLVVGAGPAGLAAATEAARHGARVVVVDESPEPGGALRLQLHEDVRQNDRPTWRVGLAEARKLAADAATAGVRLITGTSVWGAFPGWEAYLTPVDPGFPGNPPDLVRASAMLIATGAAQHPLGLPGWTLPGVLSAGAAQILLNVHRVPPGRRAVVVGVDPLGILVARQLTLGGVEVAAILPPAPAPYAIGAAAPDALDHGLDRFAERTNAVVKRSGAGMAERVASIWETPIMLRRAATAIVGTDHVEGVLVARVDDAGQPIRGTDERWDVDVVVASAGLFPLVDLVQSVGCPLVHIAELGGHVPLHGPNLETPIPGLFVAGSVTGVAPFPVAAAQGRLAGRTAAAHAGRLAADTAADEMARASSDLEQTRSQAAWLTPDADRGLTRLAELWGAQAESRPA